MKPLYPQEINTFLERFCHFQDSELRSLEIIDATTLQLTLVTQDKARDFDWIEIKIEFSGVCDAHLPKDSQLSFLDTSDGFSLLYKETLFGCGIGNACSMETIKNSTCFIVATNIKFQENLF
jgi:hypothetical protein